MNRRYLSACGLLASLGGLGAGCGDSSSTNGPSGSGGPLAAAFDWEMQPHFPGMEPGASATPTASRGACAPYETCDGQDNDCDGSVDSGGVCQKPRSAWDPAHGSGWDTWLDASLSTAPDRIVEYVWDIELPGGTKQQKAAAPRVQITFPEEATYRVTLTVRDQAGGTARQIREVTIRNFIIASLGDSIASGEGNPDVPLSGSNPTALWQDRRCHRSLHAGHAQAARLLEEADKHSSVTFVSLACSGASIAAGLLAGYGGQETLSGDSPELLPSQIDELARILPSRARKIDALLLQIGANDVKFADVVTDCAVPTFAPPGFGEDLFTCATDEHAAKIKAALGTLAERYATLGRGPGSALRSKLTLDDHRVYISDYPDPTHKDDGSFCNELRLRGAVEDAAVALVPDPNRGFLSQKGVSYLASTSKVAVELAIKGTLSVADRDDGVISGPEVSWAHAAVVLPLNQAVRTAASENLWTYVPGATEAFSSHGYCASTHWVVTYDESKKLQRNRDGTIHPNVAGHTAYGGQLFGAMARDLGVPIAVAPGR